MTPFWGKRKTEQNGDAEEPKKIPPGQYLVRDFPVLTAGPTPPIFAEDWSFTIEHNDKVLGAWSWDEMRKLERTELHTDIHCVTRWSKLDTDWAGVTIETFLQAAGIEEPPAPFIMFQTYGGYTTNLPVADVRHGKAMVAYEYDGRPITPEHGGPARLFVPHLYLWKSAKWIKRMCFMEADAAGFWESYGYHMYGDPWREQRFKRD